MSIEELKEILAKHLKWVHREEGGELADLRCADLRCADLRCADLEGANLRGADLRGADLRGANLRCANLGDANLKCADLYGADLYGADLRCADLRCADLEGANLYGANLRCANLYGANLRCANLYGANLRCANLRCANLRDANLRDAKNIPFIACVPPDTGSFVGWKKARGLIVKLLIPEDAKRSSATSRKCRCAKAKVLSIENIDGTQADVKSVASDYSDSFIYEVGKEVKVDDFCENRWIECAAGIHFFVNRQEAVNY